MLAGLSLMLILRDVSGMSINKFIYFGFTVALMASASYQTMVYMICFMLPLFCGLPGTYIMPCALVLLIMKKGKVKAIQFVGIFGILLLELIAALWYPSLKFADLINYVSFAAMMVFLVQDDAVVDYRQCVKLYLLGTLVLCGVIMWVTFADAPKNWMRLFAEGQFRIGEVREESVGIKLSLNANSLAYYSLVGIFCSLLLMEKTTAKIKILYWAVILLLVSAGFLTLSRSWMLIFGICLLLYILGKMRSLKQLVVVLVAIGALIALAVYIFSKNPELLAGFETRFTDDTVETGGSRIGIFQKYMEIYFSNFRFVLLGTGVTQGNVVAGMVGSMHNGSQQILVCCGLVGFVLYMVILVGAALKASVGKKVSLVYWMPLLSVVVFTQTIQFLNPTMLMLPYVIGIYGLKCAKDPCAPVT